MAGDLLLVGSIPLDTPEQVFRRVGGPLGPYLAYMPDGEVGDRRYWIDGIAYAFSTAILRSKRCTGQRPTRTASRVGGRWGCTTSSSSASSRRRAGALRRSGLAARLHKRRDRLAFRLPPIAEGATAKVHCPLRDPTTKASKESAQGYFSRLSRCCFLRLLSSAARRRFYPGAEGRKTACFDPTGWARSGKLFLVVGAATTPFSAVEVLHGRSWNDLQLASSR